MSALLLGRSFLLVLAAFGPAGALSLSGSATTSLLMTDRRTTSRDAVSRMPLYENVTLLLGSMAGNRLSFEGSLRGWRDLKGNAPNRDDLRLYRACARWRDSRSGLEIVAGRQLVSEGVARTYLDGLYGKQRLGGLSVTGFFGQPLRKDLDGAERWDKAAYQWGTQADWRTSAKLRLALSYTEMRHDGDTGLRLIGGSATYRIDGVRTVRARLDFDAANTRPDRVFISWTKQPERNTLYSVEAYYQQARLWAFSPLLRISGGHLIRLTGTMVRPLRDQTRLYTSVSAMSPGKGGASADVGVMWRSLRVGYLVTYLQMIFGNALYVQGSYRVNGILLVGGRTNWTRYELDEADGVSQTIGSALFATVTPVRGLDVTGEIHEITDDYYTYQLEGLVSLRYRFERVTGR